MNNTLFRNLVVDSYNISNDQEHTKIGSTMGVAFKKKNFNGTIYGIIGSYGFNDIDDIDIYLKILNPYRLVLKSYIDKKEVEIYEDDLIDYNVEENKIIINLSNRVLTIKIA